MPERGFVVCVLVVRAIGMSVWVLRFCAFVVGCCVRVIDGGICHVLGFVVRSFFMVCVVVVS